MHHKAYFRSTVFVTMKTAFILPHLCQQLLLEELPFLLGNFLELRHCSLTVKKLEDCRLHLQ